VDGLVVLHLTPVLCGWSVILVDAGLVMIWAGSREAKILLPAPREPHVGAL